MLTGCSIHSSNWRNSKYRYSPVNDMKEQLIPSSSVGTWVLQAAQCWWRAITSSLSSTQRATVALSFNIRLCLQMAKGRVHPTIQCSACSLLAWLYFPCIRWCLTWRGIINIENYKGRGTASLLAIEDATNKYLSAFPFFVSAALDARAANLLSGFCLVSST